ncbi:MAG: DUF968 domain-containing protein [Planctomycetia bacterium]|nr:DUF968 domain-containing protein [Planctomycetia bacterium]
MSVEDYKNHVRKLPCTLCGRAADPHHLKAVGMGRKRSLPKWEDYTLVPLERRYHVELEQIGISRFHVKHNINLYKEALFILAQWIFSKSEIERKNLEMTMKIHRSL